MRSALICVFLALIVRKGGSVTVATEEFKPTPIPVGDWQKGEGPAEGALDDAPISTPVLAHYWEEALRHSVYLTLVRDKIDQLIAKGEVISPDKKPEPHSSKEGDDHDLWEKIKTAPFDRIPAEEPPTYGDVTILAKGRLMEEPNGFRFVEDERSREKCYNDTCMEGVKALWSVKRVKQWEPNAPPIKYHYELTFSVISQPPKKQKKPFENPIRTFTVRENIPENVVDRPKEHRSLNPTPGVPRPERAIWFHKNVVPTQRPYLLDRIFSSFLFDDDDEDEPPRKLRAHAHPPHPYPQHAKIGYVGSPSEQQMHKRPGPYKITYKYHTKSPLIGAPIIPQYHQYSEPQFSPYPAQSAEHISKYAPVKTIRPTSPTFSPSEPVPSPLNVTVDNSTSANELNATEGITKPPEIITVANRPYPGYSRPIPGNHYPEHIRPPVYNAPPGVFVTMDKKPFKPMPPLKIIHSTKPYYHKISSRPPYDFRPSPQVLDVQFSEPDQLTDSAFRPITMSYAQQINTTEGSNSNEQDEDYKRKTNRKPPKKHENIKAHRLTTSAPEIITAHSNIEETAEDAEWTKLLDELAKNTPSTTTESDKENDIEISTTAAPTTSSTTAATVATTTVKRRTTTTTAAPETTTTVRPKRTRPPPEYLKAEYTDKKKHKRRTTTKAPTTKKDDDLVPQASSAAASSSTKAQKDSTKKPLQTTTSSTTSSTTTTTTTTTQRPTTTVVVTTTRPAPTTTKVTTQPTTTAESKPVSSTYHPKSSNRFRQSTLLQKGTSVNHDKWSVTPTGTGSERNKTVFPVTGSFPPRRKGSNFQGYVSSTPKHTDQDDVHVSSPYKSRVTSSTSTTEATTTTEESSYDERVEEQEIDNETAASNFNEEIEYQDDNFEAEQEQQGASSDHNEFIFNVTSTSTDEKIEENKVQENQVEENRVVENRVEENGVEENRFEEIQTVETTTGIAAPKNKTKCSKKKKYQNLTTTTEKIDIVEYVEEDIEETEPTTSTTSTTTTEVEEDIFSLFGYSLDDVTSTTKKDSEQNTEASESHKNLVRPEEDFEDFFDSLEIKPRKEKDADYESSNEKESAKEVQEDDEDSPFDNEDIRDFARNSEEELDEYQVRPLSLLELMGMD